MKRTRSSLTARFVLALSLGIVTFAGTFVAPPTAYSSPNWPMPTRNATSEPTLPEPVDGGFTLFYQLQLLVAALV